MNEIQVDALKAKIIIEIGRADGNVIQGIGHALSHNSLNFYDMIESEINEMDGIALLKAMDRLSELSLNVEMRLEKIQIDCKNSAIDCVV